ncbi:MAG: hypothetical protein LBT97_14205 [Planctomycetota bacterium]|jgi:hypothetical protein|nr:hypothetical protein [Planctomycetota bacterium]
MTRNFCLLSALFFYALAPGAAAGEALPKEEGSEPGVVTLGGISYTPANAFAPESDLVTLDDPPEEGADPFAYRSPASGEGEFVPTSSAKVPRGIRILSIIHIRGGKPLAAMHIPQPTGGDLHFVSVGDVIQIDSQPHQQVTQRTQTQTAKGRRGRVTETGTQESIITTVTAPDYFYLFVKNITRDFVEIAPRARPQDAVILR